jgi:hypothetical protein
MILLLWCMGMILGLSHEGKRNRLGVFESRVPSRIFGLEIDIYFNCKCVFTLGSGTTIRHNTQTTYITQNDTTIKRNTVHKNTHTINTLHRTKIQQTQLQLYKVALIKIIILQLNSSSHEIGIVISPSLHSAIIYFTSLRWSPFNFALFITFLILFLK